MPVKTRKRRHPYDKAEAEWDRIQERIRAAGGAALAPPDLIEASWAATQRMWELRGQIRVRR